MNDLHKLELWLVGSDELAEATGSVCRISRPAPGADWRLLLRDRRPDLLLVEGVERLAPARAAGLDELLELCGQEGIPRLLWITASPFDPAFMRAGPRFEHVFSTDRGHLQLLRDAGCQRPSLLWPGTAMPVPAETEPIAAQERPDPVVWLGGWREEWPDAWRRSLLSILDPARRRQLRIAEPGDRGALGRARVVIGADPASAAAHRLPPVVLDAIAYGAAVITPHSFATVWDFSTGRVGHSSWRSLIPVVEDGEAAATEIDRLLCDDELFDETVRTAMRIVRFNHTHAHRIARLASAAGIRSIPDAAADPAFR